MARFEQARALMVDRQMARRGISTHAVLEAMRTVPREDFVPEPLREFAYEDRPLPIASGQTISQPYIIAAMVEAADVKAGDQVLEIGTGSGYAAAVLSRIANHVYTIERHAELSRRARARLAALGYRNVDVRTGDGTRGWADAAPFDVIIAAAASPEVPQTLKEQLRIGGRLVMPVGQIAHAQRLIKVTRHGENEYHEQDLGGVAFVPMIGTYGWTEEGEHPRPASGKQPETAAVPQLIARAAEPLPTMGSKHGDSAFGALFDRYADARVVLLGEASHGTSEFYQARAVITRRLIEQHGFDIVACEADWPDAAHLDRYIRHRPQPKHDEPPFRRFPTWMWRNTEFEAFIEQLRTLNDTRSAGRRVGFYGLDLYSLSASIRAVLDYLDRVDPKAARIARERYGCLQPWATDPRSYGQMALNATFAKCESEVVKALQDLMDHRLQYIGRDGDEFLDAAANARLVKNAEAYYRAMYRGAAESWNLRDTHMFETLCAILDARGPNSKALVWAHNSHIGDASQTEMGWLREELNIGQLCRERFGSQAVLIGFGTHTGSVACASEWDAPMEVKQVLPSRSDSYEGQAHEAGIPRFLLDLRDGEENMRAALKQPRLERFIGVIYRPETERWSHYSECILTEQFDAYVWFDETRAVTSLPGKPRKGVPETYPFGL